MELQQSNCSAYGKNAVGSYSLFSILYFQLSKLSAARCTAVLADEAAFLVHKCLVSAYRAYQTLSLCAVNYILLQRTLHTVLPCVDALVLQLQRAYELYYVVDRHAVAQNARDELRVVPILRVELLRETLNRRLVSALVLELEVVAALSVRFNLLYNLALRHCLRQGDALLVVLQTGEYLVRIAVEQTHESHPFLLRTPVPSVAPPQRCAAVSQAYP